MLRNEKSIAPIWSAAFGMGLLLLAASGCAKRSEADMNCVEYFHYATDDVAHQEAIRRMGSAYETELLGKLERMDAAGETPACKDSVKELFGGDAFSPLSHRNGQ